jgi:Cu/Zn superoxide dismutase
LLFFKIDNLLKGCATAGAHYNPTSASHADHSGDLGNVISQNGVIQTEIKTSKFKLDDIVGRSIVLHEKEDDLGQGNHQTSKTTGNSGSRVACGDVVYTDKF